MHVLQSECPLDHRHYTLEDYAHLSARGPALNQSQISFNSGRVGGHDQNLVRFRTCPQHGQYGLRRELSHLQRPLLNLAQALAIWRHTNADCGLLLPCSQPKGARRRL